MNIFKKKALTFAIISGLGFGCISTVQATNCNVLERLSNLPNPYVIVGLKQNLDNLLPDPTNFIVNLPLAPICATSFLTVWALSKVKDAPISYKTKDIIERLQANAFVIGLGTFISLALRGCNPSDPTAAVIPILYFLGGIILPGIIALNY